MARVFFIPVTLSLLAIFANYGTAKVWERCDLARTLLHTYQFPRNQIDTWMCIAYRESRYDSLHINKNIDGSQDYGLFQINNRYWCTNSESPQPNQDMCNVTCDKVLYSLDETIKCIKIMYAKSRNTWQPWITYPYCQKEDITQYTKGCTGL
ncbi:Lysozyme C II [Frankliniella fusca]|uniref:lysozyme n=1 Tax=Frankliniella fusca TaxID=407009 RepID=A0AAE1H0H2_9NEOP|nr:Lysozyme C II [Frankliniella fusca]